MNTKTIFQICVIAGILLCSVSFAGQLLWSYDGWDSVRQIIADGKGGCAFVREDTNGPTAEVVWLDKKGDVIYQAGVTLTNNPTAPLIGFSSKTLLINDIENGIGVVIQVNKKGQTTKIQKAGKSMTSDMLSMYSSTKLADKKGYFAIEMNMTTDKQKVLRYKFE